MSPIKLVAFTILFVLLVFVAASVAAQSEDPLGSFQPFVIGISQSVPVSVAVPVDAESGITATVPLTVSVDLLVRVDGPQQVRVEMVEPPEPAIVVATATPRPLAAASDMIVLDDIEWRVAQAWDTSQTFDYMGEMSDQYWEHTQARFVVLQLDVMNGGTAPVTLSKYRSGYGDNAIQLVDDQRRHFGPFDLNWVWKNSCEYAEANPGVGITCYVVFELPVDASGLSLQFAGDKAKQSFPVDPQPYD